MFKRFRHLFRRESDPESERPTFDLLVVEGPELGKRFTISDAEVLVGRGSPTAGRPGDVLLSDPYISREQAFVRCDDEGVSIVHHPTAKSPTWVNGEVVETHRLDIGDRITVGKHVLSVVAQNGESLAMWSTRSLDQSTIAEGLALEQTRVDGDLENGSTMAMVERPAAKLVVVTGAEVVGGEAFDIVRPRPGAPGTPVVVGRNPASTVAIRDPSVSRRHCELVWDEGTLYLVHYSQLNPTYHNDQAVQRVGEKRPLGHGDKIAVGERAAFRVDAPGLERETPPRARADVSSAGSMTDQIRRLVEAEENARQARENLEERFLRDGSFLDVDVVDSAGLKAAGQKPEHIILSFEAFRGFVSRTVREMGGQVLNSNGDELMCFFRSPMDAVCAASAVLQRLDAFNASDNQLTLPFRVRIGVHSGESLVDLKRGRAYSRVLDTAGHLQKNAPINGLLIARETLDALPQGMPFESRGVVEKIGIEGFALVGKLVVDA